MDALKQVAWTSKSRDTRAGLIQVVKDPSGC